ncbi:DNA-protecting protein DprA [Streptomyces cellulosae]|uniref:DNA-protecting protein DprA n=1 Tax=Streptomyces althioticus TaxID=83380 RepID=A0ABZ1YJP2_9ACTN|nr:DNA-protecting protein DprA [Streptomyces cellulosae]WTB86465.1 DNA-protecting protein DprA [Streptomyces cellulosae]WTB93292.1 DNA-protecting protein DprA [Streptomyces cellulosae]WTC60684.1 DNA-protecting protein DprA [Streptomyces cellulosae]
MDLDITAGQHDLLALCALRVGDSSVDWSLIARNAQTPDALAALLAGQLPEDSPTARKNLPLLQQALADIDGARRRVDDELAAAAKAGARLVTVLDADYPANLRMIGNLPPFLFVRGELQERDARSVAVVGTRQVSADGLRRAARMARELVEHDVMIASGLAKGVDAAAHEATLTAGGRTVAVMGTGIAAPVYPAENRPLARKILDQGGALISQFWPGSGPAKWTFPRRNVVTSGISLGSVVIEASSTSGAKMQARIAAEHGKLVFLIKSLVASEPWAAKMISDGRAIEVSSSTDITDRLGTAASIQRASQQRQQLALAGL